MLKKGWDECGLPEEVGCFFYLFSFLIYFFNLCSSLSVGPLGSLVFVWFLFLIIIKPNPYSSKKKKKYITFYLYVKISDVQTLIHLSNDQNIHQIDGKVIERMKTGVKH